MKLFEIAALDNSESKHANLIIDWLMGRLHKSSSTNKILETGRYLQKRYPVKGKTLYRAVRIPIHEGLEEGKTLKLRVVRPGVDVSSWSESFEAAYAVYNRSKFYDSIPGMTSVIVRTKVSDQDILFNYKSMDSFMKEYFSNEENSDKNKERTYTDLRKKYSKEKEYVVYSDTGEFNCTVILAGKE